MSKDKTFKPWSMTQIIDHLQQAQPESHAREMAALSRAAYDSAAGKLLSRELTLADLQAELQAQDVEHLCAVERARHEGAVKACDAFAALVVPYGLSYPAVLPHNC